MRRIPLTNGGHALVDDEDYERVVGAGRWFGEERPNGLRYVLRYFGRGKKVYLHRFIVDAPRGLRVDHKNGDGFTNTRRNLRVGTQTQNMRNVAKARRDSSTGVRGVFPYGNRFRARIRDEGRQIFLGYFDTIEEARVARVAAEKRLWSKDDRHRARLAEKKDGDQ